MEKKAIALQYSRILPAPFVVAKGDRYMADRLKRLAEEYNIPIIKKEEETVAALFAIDTWKEIPEELYGIVAEILSFVYLLQGKNEDF